MYNYKFENGHCIVEINGNKWMIDTGAPSISFKNNINNVNINGNNHKLIVDFRYKAVVDKVVGVSVDGIIGSDILSKTSFSLDIDGNFCFGLDNISTDNYVNIEIKSINPIVKNNALIGKINIDDTMIETLFDTGAHINYISPKLVKSSQFQNQDYDLRDYDFNNNEIISKKYLEIGILGEETYKIWFGIPRDYNSSPVATMNNFKCDAIIGLYNFNFNSPIFHKCFGIDYNNKKIYIN